MNKNAFLKEQKKQASKLEVMEMLHNVSRQKEVITDMDKVEYLNTLKEGEFMLRATYLLNNSNQKRKGELMDMFSGTKELKIVLDDKSILEELKTKGEFMKSAELYLDLINLEEKYNKGKSNTSTKQNATPQSTTPQSTTPQSTTNKPNIFKRATNKYGIPVGGSLKKQIKGIKNKCIKNK
jgi:hypothetical protein